MSKKKKRNRLLLKLILEKIDDDISSLTNFREKEKNTSQLLNFDFFNLLSNTGLRVSNIALLIPTEDRGQSKSRFRVRPRIAGKIRTTRNEATATVSPSPWFSIIHGRHTTTLGLSPRNALDGRGERNWKIKTPPPSLPLSFSLQLRVIIISIGTHPSFSYQTQRANEHVVV